MHTEQADLRRISPEDLAKMGENEVVYIKPVVEEGQLVYALHSASGNTLALMASHDAAVAAALTNDLEPLRIH